MRPKVLFVDDEPKVIAGLKRAMRKEPYEIITANSACEALDIMDSTAIDVVISDEMMPGMSGSEFITKICQDYPDTIRMILTGHASLDMAIKAINEGEIYRFFTKPCNEVDLAVTIRHALEQKRLKIENIRRTEELAETNKELESFNYTVSHDLRSPLQSIEGFTQALKEDYGDKLDEQGNQYITFVQTASKRMTQLIEDLMSLSRAGRCELHKEKVNLSAISYQIIERLHTFQPKRKYELIMREDIFAEGDERLLQIVMENLLNNAWKFTEKRKKAIIEFGVTTDNLPSDINGHTVYFVKDNGAGFDMKYVHKLFNAFQRLHSLSEFEGNGIGLATVQRIIQRHGGKVWAEGGVDKGATFYFAL